MKDESVIRHTVDRLIYIQCHGQLIIPYRSKIHISYFHQPLQNTHLTNLLVYSQKPRKACPFNWHLSDQSIFQKLEERCFSHMKDEKGTKTFCHFQHIPRHLYACRRSISPKDTPNPYTNTIALSKQTITL